MYQSPSSLDKSVHIYFGSHEIILNCQPSIRAKCKLEIVRSTGSSSAQLRWGTLHLMLNEAFTLEFGWMENIFPTNWFAHFR